MPLPRTSESKITKETNAFRRGKHDRRKGLPKDQNPYVRSDIEDEPDLYEKWISGWSVMNTMIECESAEEYED